MKKNSSALPLSPACQLLGKFGTRWTILILLTLQEHDTLRFNELQRTVPGGISQRMLANTLHELESAGLVLRTLWPEVPPRTEYRLTPKARTLMPLLRELMRWAEEHAEQPTPAEQQG